MLILAFLLAQATTASTSNLPGVWSVGEVADCATGEAWIFTADGYYVEVKLPWSPIEAVGIWQDDGKSISYTHAHLPFSNMAAPQARRAYRITVRTPDRFEALNYKGERRVFSRCPQTALRDDSHPK